jgi:hydroxymethylpyrimidine kinase/phosphomethylpyrimidine kinase
VTGHPFRDPTARPDVLICAGLDPSGGAGLIADVRVVAELGGRPVGVVTALTVQNTTAVIDTDAMGAAQVREQLEFLLSDVEVRAVKIGMIGSSEIAKSIGQALALTNAPVVWDPVIRPSRGDVPFIDSLFSHAVAALMPHVTVLTPNIQELAFLTGATIASLADAVTAGQALARRLATAVLVKGGHLGDDEAEAVDVLCRPTGPGGPGGPGGVELLRGGRVRGGEHVHGTGCALSSALAIHLARGTELSDACRAAKAYVAARIAAPARPGRGAASIV